MGAVYGRNVVLLRRGLPSPKALLYRVLRLLTGGIIFPAARCSLDCPSRSNATPHWRDLTEVENR
jgi:hypothetical protein